MAVPESVGYMHDVSISEFDKYVGISMGWGIVLERERCAIEMELEVFLEDLCGKRAFGRRREGEVPIFNSRRFGKMFSRILVRGYFGPDRMQPFVAVCVIEVPVRLIKCLTGSLLRLANASVI